MCMEPILKMERCPAMILTFPPVVCTVILTWVAREPVARPTEQKCADNGLRMSHPLCFSTLWFSLPMTEIDMLRDILRYFERAICGRIAEASSFHRNDVSLNLRTRMPSTPYSITFTVEFTSLAWFEVEVGLCNVDDAVACAGASDAFWMDTVFFYAVILHSWLVVIYS